MILEDQKLTILGDDCKEFPELNNIYLKIHDPGSNIYRELENIGKVFTKYPEDSNLPNIYCIPTAYITTSKYDLEKNSEEWLLKYKVENKEKYHPERIICRILCDSIHDRLFWLEKMFTVREIKSSYISFVIPDFMKTESNIEILKSTEDYYLKQENKENAKCFLPLCLKKELIVAGYVEDWIKFKRKYPVLNELLKSLEQYEE